MKKQYILSLFLCAACMFNFHTLFAQEENTTTIIESIVADSDGNPIANAELFSDGSYAKTGADGKFSISMENDAFLLVKAKGYESVTLDLNNAQNMQSVSLTANPMLYDKKVNLAFRKAYEGDVVGAVTTVDPKQVMEYQNTYEANDLWTSRTLGLLGSSSVRGMGIDLDVGSLLTGGSVQTTTMVVVDGLPRSLAGIRASEIESVTFLKDANAAVLYGTAAVNGVILITTKRGEAHRKQADITARYGISTPKAYPKYLNSADYMTYYNMARANDGLAPQFSDQDISNYRTGDPYLYPNVDYYSRDYLKAFKTSFDVNGEFSGGNKVAQYYANFGWNSEGDIFDVGNAKDMRNNTFNARLNANLRVNDWIDTEIDGTALYFKGVEPYFSDGDYWSHASSLRPHEYVPLLPISMITGIDPTNALVAGRKRDVDGGKYLIGGNSTYQEHPIGNLYASGDVSNISRVFSFNNRLNFDLDQWVQGLSAQTNISFDFTSGWSQMVRNQYSVYDWRLESDGTYSLSQHGQDTNSGVQSLTEDEIFVRRNFGAYGLLSYDRTFENIHHFTGSLLAYGFLYKQSFMPQPVRSAHIGLQLGYTYDKRYMIDFSGAVVHSSRMPQDNRGGLSPTVGAAWVMSNEDFMSDVDVVDYLKIRASAGIIKTDLSINDYFMYDNRLVNDRNYSWYEGVRSRSETMYEWQSNNALTYSDRKDVNIGFEALMFGKTVGLTANWFQTVNDGLIVQPINVLYPNFYGTFVPYENYPAVKYKGFEIGLNYTKNLNEDWSVFAGVNMLYSNSERTKVDEIYENDYQYRKGRPADAMFGLEAEEIGRAHV